MIITELNKVFIPEISDMIVDYVIGYDKQIEDSHTIKKEFNAILKFIFLHSHQRARWVYGKWWEYTMLMDPTRNCGMFPTDLPPLVKAYKDKYATPTTQD